MKVERAQSGIFIVIMEKDNINEIQLKIAEVQKDMEEKGKYVPKIIFINDMRQNSTSNRNYINLEMK